MADQPATSKRFTGTLEARQRSNTHSIPAIISLQRYSTHDEPPLEIQGYTCTLCWRSFEKPCYIVGSDSRIVCVDCWRWMYDLSVCWACGEIVFRKEDAVSFGWCWWHWGCFSCLICSVPLMPPSYLDLVGHPHTGGTSLQEPPVCNHCIDLPASLPKLEQHAAIMDLPHNRGFTSKPVDWTTPRVSIFKPLEVGDQSAYTDIPKALDVTRGKPSWMSLLPSNRNPHVRPPSHSALEQRSSSPYFSCTRYSSPFSTPLERPTVQDECSQPLPVPTPLSLPKSSAMMLSRRCPGEWPSSSQSFSGSAAGSEITVEGAVVPTELILKQPLQASPVPNLSTADVMLDGKSAPETQALNLDQTGSSSSMPSLISSAMMTPSKRRQSGLGGLQNRSPRPTILRKSSMAGYMPEIPDAARHKPAYFKELSGFFASQDEKLITPSRALDRRPNIRKSSDRDQFGSRSSPALIEDTEDTSKRLAASNSEKLNVLAGKMMAIVSAGSGERSDGMLCKACRDCPCRTGATKAQRKRLVKASR